ncbi:unnamed protein product [Caretta caretta]
MAKDLSLLQCSPAMRKWTVHRVPKVPRIRYHFHLSLGIIDAALHACAKLKAMELLHTNSSVNEIRTCSSDLTKHLSWKFKQDCETSTSSTTIFSCMSSESKTSNSVWKCRHGKQVHMIHSSVQARKSNSGKLIEYANLMS